MVKWGYKRVHGCLACLSVHDTHEWIVLCIMWCDLGSSIADADLHRVNRVSEWSPVSILLHEVIRLPRPLTVVIAIYALDVIFYVHVEDVMAGVISHWNSRDPHYHFKEIGFLAWQLPVGRGYVSYFGTVKDLAVEDHYMNKDNPKTRAIHNNLKFEYYYDRYGKVGIQESVRLFDVSLEKNGLCDISSRYRKVYRKIRLKSIGTGVSTD